MATSGWTSVRCVFRFLDEGGTATYEERITVWQTDDVDRAITWAEREALEYATPPGTWEAERPEYLGLAQAFQLIDPARHGGEIFSLVRDSDLEPTAYLNHFFDTGRERQQRSSDS
ncbi:hypothetical protein FHN55_20090 [Streptomyces sp. NP160]|uniref:hypothetical protein n=1 Tax=Streptomyces sp. NP160 TaxID=2586637 RepID=UPI001119474D|nr:hypothetical protein [Streptomyces sp. NP160]TNM59800.1 hypothetical protein FHN55_20090 [Streptomyces sp. NP160]